MGYPRASPGQPLNIPASAYNSMIDLVEGQGPGSPSTPPVDLRRSDNDYPPWYPLVRAGDKLQIWPGLLNDIQPESETGVALTSNPPPLFDLVDTAGTYAVVYLEASITNFAPASPVVVKTSLGHPTETAGKVKLPLHSYVFPGLTGLRLYKHRRYNIDLYLANGRWRAFAS